MANRAERRAIDGARISQHSKYVHMIKMCDIMCNVTDYVSEDPEYAIGYIDEKLSYVKFLINLPKEFEVELYNFLNSKKLDAININSYNRGIK